MTSSRSQPGCVSIYLCGATVQAAPHIGHIRSGLNFDIMRRWFEYRGYDVTFVRNVTDIDDKIINEVGRAGPPLVVDRVRERARVQRRLRRPRLPAAHLRAARHRPHHRDDRDDARPHRARSRLRGGRQRLLRRALLPRLPGAVQPGPGRSAPAVRRGRDRQARPARLRHVEGRQARRAELGDPVGPRPARLAPGVLRDGAQVPGHRLRHPRRRHRPDLPAPRERDRPGQGLRRRVREVLGAQRLGHHERREDVEVARQLGAGQRDGQGTGAPSCCATTSAPRTTAR